MTGAEGSGGPELILPAACVRVWAADDRLLTACRETLAPRAGVCWPREDLSAVLPAPGDPAVADVAMHLARGLVDAARARRGDLRVLVFTARAVRSAGGRIRVAPSQLLDDLDRRAPELPPGDVTVTSGAASRFEVPRRLGAATWYSASAGVRVPLHSAGPEDAAAPPWRNPAVLRHAVDRVRRPHVDGMLRSLEGVEAVRVSGAFGCGKTRAVQEALRQGSYALVHVTARPARHGGPGLASQILYRLLAERKRSTNGRGERQDASREIVELLLAEGVEDLSRLCEPGGLPESVGGSDRLAERLPGWIAACASDGRPAVLVCDDLERATPADLALVARLLEALPRCRDLRLVLVSRDGPPREPLRGLRDLPEVRVPQMDPEEMELFGRGACQGLHLPEEVTARFTDEVAGNPFAFEEGLTALFERGMIHEVHSSLFFRGGRDVQYAPSERFVCHLEAELSRNGCGLPLRLLALTGAPVPDRALRSATRSLGAELDGAWLGPVLQGGLVTEAEGPWGQGIDFGCSALATAIKASLPEASARALRQRLGEALSDETRTGSWRTYELLEGTQSALDPLLAATRDHSAPPEKLAGALQEELDRRRAQGIEPAAELELLWALLPLLRAQGRLAEHRRELGRAVELATDDPNKRPALAGLEAELAEESGRLAEADRILRRALTEARGRGDETTQALLVLRLARVLVRRERYRETRTLLEQVVPALERSGASGLVASARFLLGNIALHENRLEEALALHSASLEARRTSGRTLQVGMSLSALGAVTLALGRYTESLVCYREAEELFRDAGEEAQASFALLGIGRCLTRTGDALAATAPLRQALAIRERLGDTVGQAIARLAVAENRLDLGRVADALEETRRAHFELSYHSASKPLADAEQVLGRVFLVRRDLRSARKHLKIALDAHRRLDEVEEAAFDLSWLLLVEVRDGDEYEVSRLVVELDGALAACPHAERREILEMRLYGGYEALGRSAEARGHLERAYRGLLEKTGHLPPDLRHRFLYGIEEHAHLVRSAAAVGVAG
ncbi:MAG: tetratricopeptide repeat protein [Thermoanaerobaculia bacterium]